MSHKLSHGSGPRKKNSLARLYGSAARRLRGRFNLLPRGEIDKDPHYGKNY